MSSVHAFLLKGDNRHVKNLSRAGGSFIMLWLLALPASAYRREYVVTWEGQRKPGSEVCFYRGMRGDAFSLFFTSGVVRCLPADKILDLPPGLIHAFARHKDGYASMQRDYTVNDGPRVPEQGYEKLETPLVRAAIVDFASASKALGPNQHLGLWIASTATTTGTFLPLVPGETTILTPAELTAVPLRIEGGLPIAVGDPLYLEPGEKREAVFPPQPGTSDVIVWTMLDTAAAQGARSILNAPAITLAVGDQIFRPIVPLYTPETSTLLIFRGLPPGRATLTTQGSMWKRITREVRVLQQPVTAIRESIPLVAGGSVVIHWTTDDADRTAAECGHTRTKDVPLLRAMLLRCAAADDGQKKCASVTATTTPYEPVSSVTFDGVPAGAYTVVLEPPYAKQQSLAADIVTGRETALVANFPAFGFFGNLTLNGKPMHARLIFSTGQTVTGIDGRYTATLAADPLLNQIQVEPCDEVRTLTYIPNAAPLPNSVYDIDVRLATLKVEVTDPAHNAVEGALVRFSPVKQVRPEGTEVYFGSSGKPTDVHGRVEFDDVPYGFLISVCASHERFAPKCVPVDLTKLEDRPAVVQFDSAGLRGHVAGHRGQGVIATVAPDGTETEEAAMHSDGTFLFRAPHAAPEYLVYVSDTRPLTVLPLPLVAPADLSVVVPAAPVRNVTVTVPNMKAPTGYVGVWVGGRYVPLQMLNAHMELRGIDVTLHPGKAAVIREIAETAPITIAYGVPLPAVKEFVDIFTLPQYAGVARHPVDGPSVALFE